MSTITFREEAAPATPATDKVALYAKSDGFLYSKDDTGTETQLGGTGTGAPADATYLVQVADGDLPNAQAMGALATGIVKNTATTGVQVIAVAGTDYTSPTGAEDLSNKTITASSLIATALSLLIGGFRAIFTHANSADRTYTLPNYDATLATIAGTETLTNKTLTTPTIGSFVNANHNHTDAANGGQLTDAALSAAVGITKGGTGQTTQTAAFDALAPTTTAGDIIYYNGTDNVRLPIGTALQKLRTNAGGTAPEWFTDSAGSAPQLYRQGLDITRVSNTVFLVSSGEVTVETTLVTKNVSTPIDITTNANWIGGTSQESASEYVNLYCTAAGSLLVSENLPNYPHANTASRVFNAQINGSPGLNGTSIVYDNDTGEGAITVGMLLGVYTDSGFLSGRGRGTGAAGSVNNASFALITAINTGTNTITVAAGHNINLTDNDYLIAITFGSLEYLNSSGTWYRFLGRIFNDASSNLDGNRVTGRGMYILDEGANYTYSGTSFAAIDTTRLRMDVFIRDGDLRADFVPVVSNGANFVYLDMSLDGLAIADDGTTFSGGTAISWTQGYYRRFAVLPGTHYAEARWKVSAGTATLYAGAGTASLDMHSQMAVSEVPK